MMVPGQRYVPKIQNGGEQELGEVTTHNNSGLVGEWFHFLMFSANVRNLEDLLVR